MDRWGLEWGRGQTYNGELQPRETGISRGERVSIKCVCHEIYTWRSKLPILTLGGTAIFALPWKNGICNFFCLRGFFLMLQLLKWNVLCCYSCPNLFKTLLYFFNYRSYLKRSVGNKITALLAFKGLFPLLLKSHGVFSTGLTRSRFHF